MCRSLSGDVSVARITLNKHNNYLCWNFNLIWYQVTKEIIQFDEE